MSVYVRFVRLQLILFGLAGILLLPGCGGCRQNNPNNQQTKKGDEKKKDEEEEPKENVEMTVPQVEPRDKTLSRLQVYAKTGHYVSASQDITANNFDIQGRLLTRATDRDQDPLGLPGTQFFLEGTRLSPLSQGTKKRVESVFYLPRMGERSKKRVWLQSQLTNQTGRILDETNQPTLSLPAVQYFLIALADSSERYAYLNALDSIRPPWQITAYGQRKQYYHVVLPSVGKSDIPLPSYSFSWTGFAYIIWDKIDPKQFTERQQKAMLDWIHWGGQLIVVGPDSLGLLRGSFLEPYLPASEEKARNLTPEDFSELNQSWTLRTKKEGEFPLEPSAETPPAGSELKLERGGSFVETTGKLIAEKRVGKGRVAVTAFGLADRWFVNWKGVDNFFNGCILRRPRREFFKDEPFSRWADYDPRARLSPMLVTGIRYFTRDLSGNKGDGMLDPKSKSTQDIADLMLNNEIYQDYLQRFSGYGYDAESGVGGWSHQSEVARRARVSLKEAAGIQIPTANFVFRILAGYLLILVPANWLLFRLIGRVELAWIMAPIVAIVGTVFVIRLAQLDIGFVRSRTEIAVIEIEGGYDRGHLTRYTALYSSLASSYSLQFDDDSAAAQPFANTESDEIDANPTGVIQDRNQGLGLNGFLVPSNKTGMIQSQQMYSLDGTFTLSGDAEKGFDLRNGTRLPLEECGILMRDSQGNFKTAWIGNLESGTSTQIRFSPASSPWLKEWNESTLMSSAQIQAEEVIMEHDEDANGQLEPKELKLSDEEFLRRDRNQDNRVTQPELVDFIRSEAESDLRLGALVFAATNRLRLANGDVRLVGWTSHECEGLTVEPVAAQKKSAALVVVHLRRGSMIRPLADINAKLDFPSLMDEGTDPIIPGVEEFDNDPNQPPGGTPGQPLRRIN